MSSRAAQQIRKEWPPVDGALCRVNGTLGRSVGTRSGRVLAAYVTGRSLAGLVPRQVLVGTGTRATIEQWRSTPSRHLPTDAELEALAVEYGLRKAIPT